jgi:aryl-phospho-beta-D-glucosidase BglC (GH1 family)
MSAPLSSHPQEILGVIAANSGGAGGFRNHVVDVHYYNLYDDTFDHMTLEDNIRYVRDKRPAELGAMQRADGPPVLVGEWAAEWGNKPRGGASGDDYGRFAQAQPDVFGAASFGWAYWTYRNDDAGDPGWSLKEMMQQGIVSFT